MTNVTHIVLHDSPDAIVYSSCYTNGIGTVYFDAANADITDPGAELIVEVAKRTKETDQSRRTRTVRRKTTRSIT